MVLVSNSNTVHAWGFLHSSCYFIMSGSYPVLKDPYEGCCGCGWKWYLVSELSGLAKWLCLLKTSVIDELRMFVDSEYWGESRRVLRPLEA
jgi:hypothetical protein